MSTGFSAYWWYKGDVGSVGVCKIQGCRSVGVGCGNVRSTRGVRDMKTTWSDYTHGVASG